MMPEVAVVEQPTHERIPMRSRALLDGSHAKAMLMPRKNDPDSPNSNTGRKVAGGHWCAERDAPVVGNQHTSSETVSARHTSDPFVPIRILTLPAGKLLEGIVDVGRFKVGEVYEVGPRLAELLIALGHAALERRQPDSGRTGGHAALERRRASRTRGDSPEGR
jgi:hypothetical protein